MKIALFSETYLPQINGVATHIKTLKEGLETLGHRVLVVTADPKAAGHYVEHGILHCPATELKDLYGYGMAASYSPERMRFIKEFSPDIAHVHTEFGIGSTGLETARELRIPLIYTLHTMWDEYLHYIASPTLFPAVRRLVYAYIRYFAKQADAIIGPSESTEVPGHLRCRQKSQYDSQCGGIRQVFPGTGRPYGYGKTPMCLWA